VRRWRFRLLSASGIVGPQTRADARAAAARTGVRLEQLTVAWMSAEAAAAFWVGAAAHSPLVLAFGMDSVVELVSGAVLLRRLSVEAGGSAYILATSAWALLAGARPDPSVPGLGLALAAVIAMPLLARAKRGVAARIESAALRGDAACSLTCAALAGALLAGLALHLAFGWWWAQPVASLGFLYWLVPEARSALAAARHGRMACCEDAACGG